MLSILKRQRRPTAEAHVNAGSDPHPWQRVASAAREWHAAAGALLPKSRRDIRTITGNRVLCAWLHVGNDADGDDGAADVDAAGIDCDAVASFHNLARRVHACNFHRDRGTAIVCIITFEAASYAAAVALLDALPHRRDGQAFTMPRGNAALTVFDAATVITRSVDAAATSPLELLQILAVHPEAADDPTLRTLTDGDILTRGADVIMPFSRVLREFSPDLLPPRVAEPLDIAVQYFTLHTLRVWDAVRDWATDMAAKLPPAVVWINTSWAPLPCVADILFTNTTAVPLMPMMSTSLLNDVVTARAIALGPSRVLLVSASALDMPHVPHVCGIDTRTGESFVYAQVLTLLESVASATSATSTTSAPARAKPPPRKFKMTYVEVKPQTAWPWIDATLALRAAYSASASASASPSTSTPAPSPSPWAPRAVNLAHARACLGVAALADVCNVARDVAAAAAYLDVPGLRGASDAVDVRSTVDAVTAAEQVVSTACAQKPQTLWALYAVLSGAMTADGAAPPLHMAPTPTTAKLQSVRTRTPSRFTWLQTQPFAIGFSTGAGACWPVVTLPPHTIGEKTYTIDAFTPRSLDAPCVSVYMGATRFETQLLQSLSSSSSSSSAVDAMTAVLRHAAPTAIAGLDGAPRTAFATLCRLVGPHPSWVDAHVIFKPPLLLYAGPHRSIFASTAAYAHVRVRVFGRDSCPYTRRALALLKKRGIPHAYVAVERASKLGSSDALQRQVAARNHRTLPCIFVDDMFLGGADALLACAEDDL